ncbi:MAG: neutral/alkaline non-lysosomal ceramidase N-terminal domain-containing protein, partial [Planctomycetia bacterium]|nr:neutral/alkaline non-lysosomal ceramidase N-terminal domain-containing protein [Planctomycetia bacterium]
MIGHLIGAAGPVDAVASILAIRDGVVSPTINLETPDPDWNLGYFPNSERERKVATILSNSFGFGARTSLLSSVASQSNHRNGVRGIHTFPSTASVLQKILVVTTRAPYHLADLSPRRASRHILNRRDNMKNKNCRRRSLLLFVGLCLVPVSLQGEIRVGLSQVDITPPIGGLTAGYSSAQPTDGVHDPVSARVLVLESDQQCVALAVCDLCIYNSPWLHDQMAAIGVDQLLLLNTHTHAGPKLPQDDFPSPQEPWQDAVDQRLLAAITQAKQDTFKGYFAAAESQIQLGYNRLVHRGDFSITHFENPERIPYGSVDRQVGIIRVTDEQQKVRAVLVNYACHPVVLGPRNRKISADYTGVMREIVERSFGEDCTCIFIQGAGGDINPLMMARGDDREQDFEVVQAMGESLAEEVQRAISFLEDVPGVSNSFASSSFATRFRNR